MYRIFIIIALLGFSQPGKSQYTVDKLPYSIPGNVNNMVFTHADTGFLSITSEADGGAILKTTDGGITWDEADLISDTEIAHVLKIQMLNGTTGFAFGSFVGYKAILKTVDAGVTWQESEIPATDNVYDMHFLSPVVGYLAFYQPDIFKYTGVPETSDWLGLTYMGMPILAGCNSVYVTHTDTIFLLYNDGYTRTSIFRVDNESDMVNVTGIPGEVSFNAFFSDILFTKEHHGFITGEDKPDGSPVKKGIILKSIDGGSSFELLNTPHLLAEKNAGLLQIDMLNDNIGAVLGNYYGTGKDTSLILTTADGGSTWIESELHVPLHAEAISQPDENTFFVAGDSSASGGVLYKFTQQEQNLFVTLPGTATKYCSQKISLEPNVTYNGSNPLSYSWIPATGLSNPTIANPMVQGNDEITYHLEVSDGVETGSAEIAIDVIPHDKPEICRVSRDVEKRRNIIYLDYVPYPGIKSYNVYTDSAGIDVQIDRIPQSNNMIVIDTASWRVDTIANYFITVTDSCDLTTEKSNTHNTLEVNLINPMDDRVTLTWNEYIGGDVVKYVVFRDTGNEFEIIGETANAVHTFTDSLPIEGKLRYQVAALLEKLSLFDMVSDGIPYSYSNIVETYYSEAIPSRKLNWYPTQSALTWYLKESDSVCMGFSIFLDTLYSIDPGNLSENSWMVMNSGENIILESNEITITRDTIVYLLIEENNGCAFFDSTKIHVRKNCSEPNQINKLAGFEFSLFPNPNDGILHLKIVSSKFTDYQFIMVNTINQIVYKEQFSGSGSFQKTMHHLQSPGCYLGVVYQENKMVKSFPIIVY